MGYVFLGGGFLPGEEKYLATWVKIDIMGQNDDDDKSKPTAWRYLMTIMSCKI